MRLKFNFKIFQKFLPNLAESLFFKLPKSISRGAFPNACKVVRLKPKFKKDKRTDSSNYRPISLPPVLPKVIEKVVHNQTNAFLFQIKIYYETTKLALEQK